MGRGAVDWEEANEMPASVTRSPNRKDLWQWAELKQQLLWCHFSINWVSARSRNAVEEAGIRAQAPFLKCIPLPYAAAIFLHRSILFLLPLSNCMCSQCSVFWMSSLLCGV